MRVCLQLRAITKETGRVIKLFRELAEACRKLSEPQLTLRQKKNVEKLNQQQQHASGLSLLLTADLWTNQSSAQKVKHTEQGALNVAWHNQNDTLS